MTYHTTLEDQLAAEADEILANHPPRYPEQAATIKTEYIRVTASLERWRMPLGAWLRDYQERRQPRV